MTQTAPTRPRRLRPGYRVIVGNGDPGTVRASDAFYDTLRLRGVSPQAQVLVELDDMDLCIWTRTTDLALEGPRCL